MHVAVALVESVRVRVAVRVVAKGLAAAEKSSFPFPFPEDPEVIVNQLSLLTAVQFPWATTSISPVPPLAPTLVWPGLRLVLNNVWAGLRFVSTKAKTARLSAIRAQNGRSEYRLVRPSKIGICADRFIYSGCGRIFCGGKVFYQTLRANKRNAGWSSEQLSLFCSCLGADL